MTHYWGQAECGALTYSYIRRSRFQLRANRCSFAGHSSGEALRMRRSGPIVTRSPEHVRRVTPFPVCGRLAARCSYKRPYARLSPAPRRHCTLDR